MHRSDVGAVLSLVERCGLQQSGPKPNTSNGGTTAVLVAMPPDVVTFDWAHDVEKSLVSTLDANDFCA